MSAKDVWEKGWPVFESWARAYVVAPDSTISTLNQYYTSKGFADGKKRFKEIGGVGSFVSRFHSKDFLSIERTFRVLADSYHARLSNLVLERVSYARKHPKNEVVRRVSASMFLLTYETRLSIEETIQTLKDPLRFEEYFAHWLKHATLDKKRLWASLRDYVKIGSSSHEDFISMLEAKDHEAAEFWETLGGDFDYLNQLELPGDVWNDNPTFRQNLLNPIAIALGVNPVSARVSDLARLVCQAANALDSTLDIYPEQLDVSYSFVPRMCDHEGNDTGAFCREFCPFGSNGASSVYSKDLMINTAALILASFLTKRKHNDEVIMNGLGKGTCKMIGGSGSTRGLV